MIELSRTVRFCVSRVPPQADNSFGNNTFAAFPSMVGLGAYYELVLFGYGSPDSQTGYLMNITELDAVARRELIPRIQEAFQNQPQLDPLQLIPELCMRFQAALPKIAHRLAWRLTPYYCLSILADDMTTIRISQQFEFSAAHRLHVDILSDTENRSIFGKCNNMHGHGHNYRVEVAVDLPRAIEHNIPSFTLAQLEKIVHETIITRFDHKNLNRDCPEFEHRNPSVEHITQTCFDLLGPAMHTHNAQLHHVTIWETEKTSCTVARDQ